ncbi:MAG: caspase family protein [Bacteroides sp.]|nr:caspase family protein [Bacteroides sp.]MBQ8225777.1 caspase family protein [Bacteroides sp.]
MKRLFILTIILLLGTWMKVAAQDAATASKRGNQQFVLFESERDKGGADPTSMYNYLLDSYQQFVKVTEAPNNTQYLNGAKNRLRSIYPYLIRAAIYYSQEKQPIRFLEFASAYIELPNMRVFRSELLNRDPQYPYILFNAALNSYNMKKYDQTVKYFKEFLNTGSATELQVKDAYVYMNMAYLAQKNYAEQEKVLEEAISKFPVSLDFLYNLVNVHIATNNIPKLLNTIDRILAVDPNNEKVLPLKAQFLMREKRYEESLELYQRLHALYPDDLVLMGGLATANFNIGSQIIQSGRTVVDETEYALILHRASDYFYAAKPLFEQILAKQPTSKRYMAGLLEIHRCLRQEAEAEVLSKMLEEGAPYTQFQSRLVAYNEAKAKEGADKPLIADNGVPMPTDPPMLEIRVDSFIDGNANKVIDAGESFAIQFTVENKGLGDAYNLRIRLSEEIGLDEYFDGQRELDGGNIPAGTSKEYTFRYLVSKDLPKAQAKLTIYAFEANKFHASPLTMNIYTEEYAMPRLRIADYQFNVADGTSMRKGSKGKLVVAVQNYGAKMAHNVKLNFKHPSNVFDNSNPTVTVDTIAPGGHAMLEYEFMVNNEFDADSLAIMLDVTESTRQSYIAEAFKVKMGVTIVDRIVDVGSRATASRQVQDVTIGLQSELLEGGVPMGAQNPHRYALILGNEDYKTMTGADGEINVPYAINDAHVFSEYCKHTFGVPQNQMRVIFNATAGMMAEGLGWLESMAHTDPEAELIFYYSGHGNPDEATKEPYLLPVDVTGKNTRFGISLADLYNRLAKYPIKGAYVFLDACFSGGYKSTDPLVAQKGVRVVPKAGLPQGNTISFSSSSGDQTSSVFHAKKHGYYTYYLLKALKDANGDLTMKELFNKTHDEVAHATAVTGKLQEPQHMISPIFTTWADVKLKTPEATAVPVQ